MSSSMMSKVADLFDARFAVSYLAPAAVGAGTVVLIAAVEQGVSDVAKTWKEMEATPTISGGIAVIAALIIVAYLIQSMSTLVLQFWEGHYLPEGLARRLRNAQQRKAQRIAEEVSHVDREMPHHSRYFSYPRQAQWMRPTRLANAFAAAHEYPLEAYGLDGVLWWPRLLVVLPDDFRKRIDDAMVPVLGLLNLGTVFALTTLAAGLVLFLSDETWFPFWMPPLLGVVTAWLCYRGAVGHAVTYGGLIRVAFDFHRLDILRKMSLPVPTDYEMEHALWDRLNRWVFTFEPPCKDAQPSDPAWLQRPFKYALGQEE